MPVNVPSYQSLNASLSNAGVALVAVSKTKPASDVQELYDLGHRDFGENYVQELTGKAALLPTDIRWHFIGHLQSNKVKYIAPFVHLIHGVDSLSLLKEINKVGIKLGKEINCLLQVHIAEEETKFGFDENEIETILKNELPAFTHIHIKGLMGMASFSSDMEKVRMELRHLKELFDRYRNQEIAHCNMQILSMGMSGDYKIAVEEGSTMVRIGSLLFGVRS